MMKPWMREWMRETLRIWIEYLLCGVCVAALGWTYLACAPRRAVVKQEKPHSVRLSWKAAPGAISGYHVYRMADVGGWELLRTVDPGVTDTVDTSVASGMTYRYKVRAFEVKNGATVESADSGIVTARVPQ